MEEDIKNLLETVVKRYIEEYIINLDLSDSTKNILKRQLRKTFLDEDLLYDLGTIAHKNSIPTSLVKEKIEEINKAYEDSKDENGESQYYYPDYTIRVLEELLEKRK